VIVPGARLPVVAGAIAPAGGGRTIFVLPWLGQTLIGTTDNDYEGDLEHVHPAEEDVAYLLEATNAFFADSLGPGDLAGAYAGVRPLISTGDPRKSVDISRKAELYETSSGMVTITGGKLTTWRRMAKLAVDRIVEREGRDAPCQTHQVPLGMAVEPADLPHVPGVPEDAYEQLAGRYGYAAHEVLRLAAERPELVEPLQPGRPDLLAEAVHAARREQARTVGDVLLRRTRLALTAGRDVCAPGSGALGRVAAALGREPPPPLLGLVEQRLQRDALARAGPQPLAVLAQHEAERDVDRLDVVGQPAGLARDREDHRHVLGLAVVDDVEDPVGALLDAEAHGGQVGRCVVVAAVGLLDDERQRRALARREPLDEDALRAVVDLDQPRGLEVVDHVG
jgi:hypothetical protein